MAIASSVPVDLSDRLDGPSLIAVWGNDDPGTEYRLGTREYGWHTHSRGQVLCVESGLIHVRTEHGSWLLPPHRAGWVPPGVSHAVSVSGALSGWSLFISPDAGCDLPDAPRVIGIGELMRALVRRAVSWNTMDTLQPDQQRVVAVLLDEIAQAPQERLHLPMPSDPRLVRIANAILAHPENERTLDEWAAMSSRTLRRLILAETGLSFSQWRQQARLTHALEMLARGDSVGMVSDALGYAAPSSFITMFRRSFGDSPGHYFAGR